MNVLELMKFSFIIGLYEQVKCISAPLLITETALLNSQ